MDSPWQEGSRPRLEPADGPRFGRRYWNRLPELAPVSDCQVDAIGRSLGERILLEEFNGSADGKDGFRGIVGNLKTKLPFEFDCQFDHIETIGAEIIDEACVVDHLIGIDKQLLNHDCPGAFGNVEHCSSLHDRS
jgi:hypothetical protein